jgi:hypothetical protein
MALLLVLIAVTLLARGMGLFWTALSSWVEAARVGLKETIDEYSHG